MGAPAKPPASVVIADADGSLSTIAAKDLAAAKAEGAELATPEQVKHAEYAAKYGGVAGTAGAAAAGVARGLTFGGSDAASVALGGDETKERLNAYKDISPIASVGGEAVGALAPIFLTGGAAAPEEAAALGLGRAARGAAEVAGAIPRGVAALGGLAERGAARVVGEGAEGLGARMLQKGAAVAAGSGVEGGLYSGGQIISENALSEHPDLTAEKLFAGMAKGALLGAGLGAVAGAGGALLGDIGKSAARIGLGAKEGESLAETGNRLSGEFAWRSAGGTKAMASSAEKYAGGISKVGKVWRDEAPGLVGKKSFGQMTREDLAQAAEAGLAKDGARLDSALSSLDEKAAKIGAQPRAVDVVRQLHDDVIAPMKAHAGTHAAQAKLQSFVDDIGRITGMIGEDGQIVAHASDVRLTFKQLRDLRVDADKIWAGNSVDPSLLGFKADFKKARDILEDHLITSGDKVAEHAGGNFSKEYTEAKHGYQAWKILEKAAGSGVAAQSRNRLLSLTDNIVGAAGAHVGAAVGSAFGPAGAAAGAAIGGAVGAGVNHVMRQRFDFVASEMLGKMAQLAEIKRLTTSVDDKLASGVRSFLRHGATSTALATRTTAPRGGETRATHFQRVANDVTDLSANPGKMQNRIGAAMGNMSGSAPNTSAAFATKTAAGLGWLASQVPAARVDPYDFQQHKTKQRPPSDMDMEVFFRKVEAFKDPFSLLDGMKKGRISREAVETVKNVYPEIFREIQTRIKTELTDPKTPKMTFNQQAQLSALYGVPANAMFEPSTIADLQKNFSAPDAGQDLNPEATPTKPPGRPLEVQTGETDAQKIEGK